MQAMDLDDALRARGLRATVQRRMIYDAVLEMGHSTPEQICAKVQADAPAVNLSTVYRSLELLETLGVVSHTHLGHGSPSYHATSHADHIHLVCRSCEKVEEAPITYAASLGADVAGHQGFTADLGHLSLHGVCADCAAREASEDEKR